MSVLDHVSEHAGGSFPGRKLSQVVSGYQRFTGSHWLPTRSHLATSSGLDTFSKP